ncbi:universal stress protein [Flavobacterium psychrotolerans]|uniref:Universal stress protein UspA n=1 Tax=Flavobacterium psychrotolerans TaxID=2169410 RepID=A0A2U1JM73_9FLAO|nr:universal stress protein [Flavobacterium psychrotolerans]PWA06250.1 universal stress protein UspA [Flavobacterium psychrotolerans]
MKKILFPTDFSDVSKNAFVYALKLAKHINAEIITLHVYELPQVNYIDVPINLIDIYEVTELSNFENYKQHVPVLRAIAEKNKLEHIKISNVLVDGDLIANIVRIAEEDKIDYIVLGTKGATGLASTFLGSVTTKVMNNTKAVVLAIPEHCQYQPIKKILFTTQFKGEDIETLNKVIALAKVFRSDIDCLYVKMPDAKDNEVFIENWKKIFVDQDVTFHTITSNDVEGIVLSFIDLHHVDMIAMHIHHKSFFERLFYISLSKKLAYHINIPILAIH